MQPPAGPGRTGTDLSAPRPHVNSLTWMDHIKVGSPVVAGYLRGPVRPLSRTIEECPGAEHCGSKQGGGPHQLGTASRQDSQHKSLHKLLTGGRSSRHQPMAELYGRSRTDRGRRPTILPSRGRLHLQWVEPSRGNAGQIRQAVEAHPTELLGEGTHRLDGSHVHVGVPAEVLLSGKRGEGWRGEPPSFRGRSRGRLRVLQPVASRAGVAEQEPCVGLQSGVWVGDRCGGPPTILIPR